MNITVNVTGIDEAIQRLRDYGSKLRQRERELCRRLAEYGLQLASISYASAAYDGPNDISVSVEEAPNGYQIIATGVAVAFVEFGAGVTLGYGHPQAAEFGAGPGTYPGKGHWNDPKGWWLPKDKGGGHTYGNPPSMTMYNTTQDIKQEIAKIAREVFA